MIKQPPAWVGTYVGIPYRDHGSGRSGADCWGLVRLVYLERVNIMLPAYAGYVDERDGEGIGRCVEVARAGGSWRRIEPPPQAFDVAEMLCVVRTRAGWSHAPLHVGLVVAPGWLLHTEIASAARLLRLDDRHLGKRIAGYWRYRRLDAGD